MENAEDATSQATGDTSLPSRLVQSAGALSQPMFRRYWLGTMATAGSLQVLQIGVGWLVVTDLGGGAGVLGIIGGTVAIPSILVSLFGGVLADRIDRRLVLMFTSTSNGLLMTVLAVLVVTETVEIWHIVLIAAGQGFLGGIDLPARAAFFPLLIKRQHLPSAVSLNAIVWHLSRLITPTIGGLSIRYLGTESVFFAGAGGWVAMLLIMFTLRVAPSETPKRRNILREIGEGFGYVSRNRLFAVMIPLTAVKTIFGLQYLTLMPLFAVRHGVQADGFGVFYLSLSLGAITGSIVVQRFQYSARAGRMMLASGIVFSVLVAVFAYSPNYWTALVAIYLVGIPHMIFITLSMTILQVRVAPEVRGRVIGIYMLAISMIPLGGLVGGGMAELMGERLTLSISAAVFGIATLWVLATQSVVRNLSGGTEFTP